MTFHQSFRYAVILCALSLLLWFPRFTDAQGQAVGERLYQSQCAGCHSPAGEGGSGPTLAKPQLDRATSDELLVRIIAEGIAGTEMPRSRLSKAEIQQIADFVRQLGRLPAERVNGDPQRGKKLYETTGACAQCHMIRGHGGALGPDLTDIGLRRGARHLRTSLIDPGADVPKSFNAYRTDANIPENYLQVRVITKDGRRLSGSRVNEDTFSIQIRDAANRIHSFLKSELAELHKDRGKSSMPDYREVFSPQELDDVVAYLVTLRGNQ